MSQEKFFFENSKKNFCNKDLFFQRIGNKEIKLVTKNAKQFFEIKFIQA